jgi:hypothetical protein
MAYLFGAVAHVIAVKMASVAPQSYPVILNCVLGVTTDHPDHSQAKVGNPEQGG